MRTITRSIPLGRIVENAASAGAAHAVTLGLSLISIPYMARVLGAGSFGKVAFALSIAQLLAVLSDYGLELTGTRAVAVQREDRDALTRLWCSITVLKVGLGLLGLAAVAALSFVSTTIRANFGLVLAASTLVWGNVLFPQWLYNGLERLKLASALQTIARIVAFGLVFLWVRTPGDIYPAVLVQTGIPLLAGVLAIPSTLSLLNTHQIRWPAGADLASRLRQGWHVFWSSVAINACTAGNAFLLGLLASPAVLGPYHLADRLIRAAQSLYGPVSVAVYPHVARLASHDVVAALRFNRRMLAWAAIVSGLLGIAVFLFGPWAVHRIFGPEYTMTGSLLKFMAVLPLAMAFSSVLGTQTMLALRMDRAFTRILILGTLINWLAFVPAVHWFSAWGAAGVTVGVELLVVAAMAFVLKATGCSPLTRVGVASRAGAL